MSAFSTAHETQTKPDRSLAKGSGMIGPVQLPAWFPESMQEQARAPWDAIGALRRDCVGRRAIHQRRNPIGDLLCGLAKPGDGPVDAVLNPD